MGSDSWGMLRFNPPVSLIRCVSWVRSEALRAYLSDWLDWLTFFGLVQLLMYSIIFWHTSDILSSMIDFSSSIAFNLDNYLSSLVLKNIKSGILLWPCSAIFLNNPTNYVWYSSTTFPTTDRYLTGSLILTIIITLILELIPNNNLAKYSSSNINLHLHYCHSMNKPGMNNNK